MTGIADIENAILARLEAAGGDAALGYRFRTLESYPEDFDARLKEVVVSDAAFPAAWVVFGGWRNPTAETSSVQAPAVFMLVVAAQNLRNERATRHGVVAANGRKEVGAYQLMMDAARLLHGQHLGLDIQPLQLGPCRSVRATLPKERQLSMFALEFSTLIPIDLTGFPVREIGDFSTFNAEWDVQPFGEAALDPADAADNLELPA